MERFLDTNDFYSLVFYYLSAHCILLFGVRSDLVKVWNHMFNGSHYLFGKEIKHRTSIHNMRKRNCLEVNQHHHHKIGCLYKLSDKKTYHDSVMIQLWLLRLLHMDHHHPQDVIHDKSSKLTLLNTLIIWIWYDEAAITDQILLQNDNSSLLGKHTPPIYLIIPFFFWDLIRIYFFTPVFSV